MREIQRSQRDGRRLGALALTGALLAGCQSQSTVEPGSEAYNKELAARAAKVKPFDLNFNPRWKGSAEPRYEKAYATGLDVNRAIAAVHLASFRQVEGRHKEAADLLIEAMQIMENPNVSSTESALALTLTRDFSTFRGTPFERAATRIQLAISLNATGDFGNARAALRGALEQLTNREKKKIAPEESQKAEGSTVEKTAEKTERLVESSDATVKNTSTKDDIMPSAMAPFVCIYAAKLSVNLGDSASAAEYLRIAELIKGSNVKAGLPHTDVPSFETLRNSPLILFQAGSGPSVTAFGDSNELRAIVPGKDPAKEYCVTFTALSTASSEPGPGRELTLTRATGNLTAEAQMESEAKIDLYMTERKKNQGIANPLAFSLTVLGDVTGTSAAVAAGTALFGYSGANVEVDVRGIGGAFPNSYFAVTPDLAAGRYNMTITPKPGMIGVTPILGALTGFFRKGAPVEVTVSSSSIFVFRFTGDFPDGFTEKKPDEEKQKSNEIPIFGGALKPGKNSR